MPKPPKKPSPKSGRVTPAPGHKNRPAQLLLEGPKHATEDRLPDELGSQASSGGPGSKEQPHPTSSEDVDPSTFDDLFGMEEASSGATTPVEEQSTNDLDMELQRCIVQCMEARVASHQTERATLLADIEAWRWVCQVGGPTGDFIRGQADAANIPAPKANANAYYRAVQLVTGRAVEDGASPEERRNQTSDISTCARFFHALDQAHQSEAIPSAAEMVDEVQQRGGRVQYAKQHAPASRSATDSNGGGSAEREAAKLAKARTDVERNDPIMPGTDMAHSPHRGQLVWMRDDGRIFYICQTQVVSLSPSVPGTLPGLKRAVTDIDVIVDVLGLAHFIPEGEPSDIAKLPGADPSDNERMIGATNLRWYRDHFIVTAGRRNACPILHLYPKSNVRLPSADLFAEAAKRRKFEKQALKEIDLAHYGEAIVTDRNSSVELAYPPRGEGKTVKLQFVPTTNYGTDRPEDGWLLDISQECTFTMGEVVIEGPALADLRQQFAASKKPQRNSAQLPVQLGFAKGQLSIQIGRAGRIVVAAHGYTGTRSLRVFVLATDILAALLPALKRDDIERLSFAANTDGAVRISFDTTWIHASLFIPTLIDGIRATRFMTRYYPARDRV